MKLFSESDINNAILDKFETKEECAEALKIDPSTLLRNIKRGTPKFIKRLEKIGVIFPQKNQVREASPPYATLDDIADLKEEMKELREENKLWRIFAINAMAELEKHQIRNGELSTQFFTLLKLGDKNESGSVG